MPSGHTVVMFDTAAPLTSVEHFFDFPYPNDTRLKADGTPEVKGMPNPSGSSVFSGLRTIAGQRKGFPQVPVAYFRFTAPVAHQDATTMLPASPSSSALLIDLATHTLLPTVASTPAADRYLPDDVLAVAARPGIILEPKHAYAFVIKRQLGDAAGLPLGTAPAFAALETQTTGALGSLYAPLWPALTQAGVALSDVVAATVFTTGDVVSDLSDLSNKVLATYSIDVTGLALDSDGAQHDGFCELHGTVTYPQFQGGTPPYDTDGLIALDANGAPIKTRDEPAPLTITIPKQPMPAGGYPLAVYFHGTGGVSDAIADRGPWHPETDATKCPGGELDTWQGVTGCNTAGQGPGYVLAPHGIAMAASALALNPQRFPAGANQMFPEYFNINNVASLRDIFRQGILEQRLFIDALRRVSIPKAALAACTGATLPTGETAFHFRDDPLLAQGQSMGAMYVNMVSAVEPRIKAVTATGAGGFWSYFILQTSFIADLPSKLGLLLDLEGEFTFMHPAMSLVQTALEPADPIVFMPRVAHEPLPGHPVRSIYQPVGKGDSYFPTAVQDAVALSYHNQEAGPVVWSSMQDALALENLSGLASYATEGNRTSTDAAATKYTGVTVQYEGDGVYDPHAIYSQLDAVKYQYGCFFETFVATGKATVPAPAALGTPCPH